MSSVQHRALTGSISNVVGMITIFLQNIVIVPVMLRYWGADLYGVWIAISALQSLLQTIDNGQQNFLGNEFNRLYHQDRVQLERLLSTGVCSIFFFGPLQVLVVLAFRHGATLTRVLGIDQDFANHNSVWLSLLVLVLGWIFSGSVGGLVVRLTYAVGYYARFNWWAVLQRVLLMVGVVVAVWRGAGLLAASITFSCVQVAINVLMLLDMIRILRRVGLRMRAPNFRLGVSMFVKSLLLTGSGLIDAANTSGLFTLLSILFSAAALPVVSTLRTLANVAMQCVSTIMNPLVPEMSRYSARSEIQKLNEMTAVCWFAAGTLINAGLLCSVLFVEPFYAMWTHGKLPFRQDLYLLLAISVAFKSIGAPWFGYLVSINAIKEQFWVTLLRGVLTLGLTYILAASAGLRGVGIALLCAEVAASLLLPLIFTQQEFQRRGHSIPWRSFNLALASVLVVLVGFGVVAMGLIPPSIPVALGVVVIGLLSLAQWRLLSQETRRRLLSLLNRGPREAASTPLEQAT